jgi:hypothetical protein
MLYDHCYMNHRTWSEDLAVLAAAQSEMASVRAGSALKAAAESVLQALPWVGSDGTLFLGVTDEGVALAATCAALSECDSTWGRLTLGRLAPTDIAAAIHLVVVEPTEPGSGWRSLIAEILPEAALRVPRIGAMLPG